MFQCQLSISDTSSTSQYNIWVDTVQASALKKKRATWSEDSLVAAVRDVRGGLSTYKASRRHGVPRGTIRNHVHNDKIIKHLGRHAILTEGQERNLVSSIIKFSELGTIPITTKMIQVQAFAFCKKFNITNNFNKVTKMAGRAWLNLFLKRNPDLAMRKVQVVNAVQAQKLNKPIKEVQKLYDELNLDNKLI